MSEHLDFLNTINYSDLSDFKEIGKGSFGVVYRADYLGTDVAVKEFINTLPDKDSGFDFKKYLSREIDMLREARHPQIVQFMGTAVREGKIYIVTEFISGGNLVQWINAEKLKHFSDSQSLLASYRTRISFAIDVARAIAYLHARGIIHRDLKLENLLLTENNRVKVCDFGFSRIVDNVQSKSSSQLPQRSSNSRNNRKLSILGTDGYMAPEIMLCLDEYDASVDVFSYGIIIVAILSLRIPSTDGTSEDEVFRRVVPGFGFNVELQQQVIKDSFKLPEGLPVDMPHMSELLAVIKQAVDEEGSKRASLKQIQATLKEVENATLAKLKDQMTNTGVPITAGSIANDSILEMAVRSRSNSHSAQGQGRPHGLQQVMLNQSMASLSSVDKPKVRMNHQIPHRFSYVLTMATLQNTQDGKKHGCDVCRKPIKNILMGGKTLQHLECDDCSFQCHIKCGKSAPAMCGLNTTMLANAITSKAQSNQSVSSKESHDKALFASPDLHVEKSVKQ